jgi:hypothetical protein
MSKGFISKTRVGGSIIIGVVLAAVVSAIRKLHVIMLLLWHRLDCEGTKLEG